MQTTLRSIHIDVIDSDLSGIVSCKQARVPSHVSTLAYLVRSRAKEFVELHDQVQVRVLLITDFTCQRAKDERGLVGQPRVLSLHVPEGPL